MPRISERFRTLVDPGTPGGAAITRAEITTAIAGASAAEVATLATQAPDAFDSPEALGVLAARTATPPQAPLSSLDAHPASRRWHAGEFTISRTSTGEAKDAVRLLQRALVKIGAHHPGSAGRPELMQMPFGADGQMGDATARAVNAAMVLGGRPDLAHATADSALGADVAEVIEKLLLETPRVTLPQLVQPAPAPARARGRVFGADPIPAARLPAFDDKWTGVLARIDVEMPGYRRDNPALGAGAKAWLEGLDEVAGRDRMFQLNRINTLVNEWSYVADAQNWGGDHWAAPSEFFARRGDCEDYAIAKYVSLLKLGFPEASMRLVVVLDREAANAMHAVLAVDLGGKTYILDNQNALALPDADVVRYPQGDARYVAVAAMNRDGRWRFAPPA